MKGLNPYYFFLLIVIISITISCKPLPDIRFKQNENTTKFNFKGHELQLRLINAIKSDARFYAKSKEPELNEILSQVFPVSLKPLEERLVSVDIEKVDLDSSQIISSLILSSILGDTASVTGIPKINFPFSKGKSYRIIQGYNGKTSHKGSYSRYAIDFNLDLGDTICAAEDGVVVGVIKDYDIGGKDRKYRPFANYITVYHYDSGIFTQYVHLLYQGSLVEIGDSLKVGQPLGLSGNTGFTFGPHLHFNVLIPTSNSMKSIPIEFEEGHKGIDLKKGVIVKSIE